MTPIKADEAAPAQRPEEELVPALLAAVVLLLLLGIFAAAGFIVRDLVTRKDVPRTAEDVAVARAREAVRAKPADKQTHLEYAFALQQDGMYPESIVEYDAVLKLDPRDTAALYNKGMVYFALKQSKKAEESLWDVLEISKTHALAAKALGEYYAGKKQYKSLIVAVKPAAEARPDMADLQYLMGLAYENTGHKDWALARYRAALQYVPDLIEARDGLKRLGAKQ